MTPSGGGPEAALLVRLVKQGDSLVPDRLRASDFADNLGETSRRVAPPRSPNGLQS